MPSEPEHRVPPRLALKEHPNTVSQSSFEKGSGLDDSRLGLILVRNAPSPGISILRTANPIVPASEGIFWGPETDLYVTQASLAIHCLSVKLL